MLFTIATTLAPATDLGFLLHKNPGRAEPQHVELSFGLARVFWPHAGTDFAQAALHVEVSRNRGRPGEDAYVSDRPYAAGSYLPAAIQRAFGTAIGGRCDSRPGLAAGPMPLELGITPVACRGTATPQALFGPLGWEVEDTPLPLDPAFPEWGSIHHRIRLAGTLRLSEALRHVCVLLPVLDGRKHYFVDDSEVDKLLRLGDGWLPGHPDCGYITRRFTGFRHLAQAAAGRMDEAAIQLGKGDDAIPGLPDAVEEEAPSSVMLSPTPHERPRALQEARVETAKLRLLETGVRRVADIGCGEGDLVAALLADRRIDKVIGVDPSVQTLARAVRRLRYEQMGTMARARVDLIQGAATYPDSRLSECDAYALLEVIEHVDPWRLEALEAAVFGAPQRPAVILTTPNREWNALIPALASGGLRHRDHRFEWTREEFSAWAQGVCGRRNYDFEWFTVGISDPSVGPATQGGLFTARKRSVHS